MDFIRAATSVEKGGRPVKAAKSKAQKGLQINGGGRSMEIAVVGFDIRLRPLDIQVVHAKFVDDGKLSIVTKKGLLVMLSAAVPSFLVGLSERLKGAGVDVRGPAPPPSSNPAPAPGPGRGPPPPPPNRNQRALPSPLAPPKPSAAPPKPTKPPAAPPRPPKPSAAPAKPQPKQQPKQQPAADIEEAEEAQEAAMVYGPRGKRQQLRGVIAMDEGRAAHLRARHERDVAAMERRDRELRAMAGTKAWFSDVPKELLWNILRHVSREAIMVCREFAAEVRAYRRRLEWRRLRGANVPDCRVFEAVKQTPRLGLLDLTDYKELTATGLKTHAPELRKLHVLVLRGCSSITDKAVEEVLSHMPVGSNSVLRGLDLMDCPRVTPGGLRRLRLLPSLRNVALGSTRQAVDGKMTDAVLNHLARAQQPLQRGTGSQTQMGEGGGSGLRRLSLQRCGGLTNLSALEHMSSSLIELDLRGAGVSSGGAKALAACTNLQSLCLADCSQLDGAILEAIVQHMDQLRTLDLSRIKGVTNQLVARLPTRCPDLQRLKLSQCTQVENSGVRALVSHLLSLVQLDITDCRRVTTSAFDLPYGLRNRHNTSSSSSSSSATHHQQQQQEQQEPLQLRVGVRGTNVDELEATLITFDTNNTFIMPTFTLELVVVRSSPCVHSDIEIEDVTNDPTTTPDTSENTATAAGGQAAVAGTKRPRCDDGGKRDNGGGGGGKRRKK
ncbi:unnamed protein product [Vitrella brassicaformis CCMP3155]|uniref:F-box domain-containing protein n=4 Tax=Vitrella brassicaformis TaxID=1169539 RepID=A0A0G4F002_VITBC|nr:unnamed protein product [Vitrella brassicaformis CCMP3155]|eukprot:CEM04851.1 unnamed protein product [Vitrella brassicaformis CCMP3155]